MITGKDVQTLAEQIAGARMRKQTYEMGAFLLQALESEVHLIAGYSKFDHWYQRELGHLSSDRALWDIIKIERVRRALDVPLASLKRIDVSKVKKIAQLCGPDGHPKKPHTPAQVRELLSLAELASLEDIRSQVDELKGK